MIKASVFLVAALLLCSGCLKTRNDVKETDQRQVIEQQTASLQKETAEAQSRIGDVQEQIRYLNGRVEVLENKENSQANASEASAKAAQQQNQELSQKLNLMQEALTKLESQVFQLTSDMQTLKAEKAAAAQVIKKDPFDAGQEYFSEKEWKKAILNYQKYRDENAKGKNFAEATYKIGVCFQELGMKDEAKTFYDEVISKYATTDFAKKAKARLKSLKKST